MDVLELFDILNEMNGMNITQEKLAEIWDIKPSAVSKRVSRHSQIPPKDIDKINEYIGYDVTKLRKGNPLENIFIPVRGNVHASMGNGIIVDDEKQTGTYLISRKFSQDIGISNFAEMIVASGDSMAPTIEGGDNIIIDTSKTEIYDGRIYCVRIDGQLYAKRLQKIPPSIIVVISDNLKYKSFEIDLSKKFDFDFKVIGEVRWWGRISK